MTQTHDVEHWYEYGLMRAPGLLRLALEWRGPWEYGVSLIGWSLGGLCAREFAKESPRAMRRVVGLGTPFTGHPKATNVWRLHEYVTGHRIGAPEIRERLRIPPTVPTTSIFSRTDGIVAWQCSIGKPGPRHENIEVQASHLGPGFSPYAWYAIADSLAQPEGKWKPFERSGAREWFHRDPTRPGWY